MMRALAALLVALALIAPTHAERASANRDLRAAAERGNLGAARAALAAGAEVNARDDRAYDALTLAAARGDHAMVELLLGAGADVRLVTSPYQGTALIAAANHGHVEVIRLLLAKQPPLDHVNNLGWTALMEAIVLGDGGPRHTETLRLLLAAGANPNIPDRAGITPLGLARQRGFANMVKVLDAAGAKP